MIKIFLVRGMEHKMQLRIALIHSVPKEVNLVKLIISFQHVLCRKGKKYFAGRRKTDCILDFSNSHSSAWSVEKRKMKE